MSNMCCLFYYCRWIFGSIFDTWFFLTHSHEMNYVFLFSMSDYKRKNILWSRLRSYRLVSGHSERHLLWYLLTRKVKQWTADVSYLSAEGGREAVVKSQHPIALHHMNSHPHHPLLDLLLCLQVYLERNILGLMSLWTLCQAQRWHDKERQDRTQTINQQTKTVAGLIQQSSVSVSND